MIVRAVTASLFVMFWCTLVSPTQSSFTIAGTVHTSSGSRISRAQVAVLSPSAGFTMQRSTDVQGEFRVEVPKPATYELQITAPGFKKLSASAVVNPGSPSVHLDLTMEAAPQGDRKGTASQTTSRGSTVRQAPGRLAGRPVCIIHLRLKHGGHRRGHGGFVVRTTTTQLSPAAECEDTHKTADEIRVSASVEGECRLRFKQALDGNILAISGRDNWLVHCSGNPRERRA